MQLVYVFQTKFSFLKQYGLLTNLSVNFMTQIFYSLKR